MKNKATNSAAALADASAVLGVSTKVELPVTVTFAYLNDTPGAHRYQEVDANGAWVKSDADGVKIGALYLRKAAFGETAPKSITVTIA